MKILFLFLDVFIFPFLMLNLFFFYLVRKLGENKLTICNKYLYKQGVLPLRSSFTIQPDVIKQQIEQN